MKNTVLHLLLIVSVCINVFLGGTLSMAFEISPRTEKTIKAFNGLNKNTLHTLDDYYHEDIRFEDPIGSVTGLKNLKKYYKKMYENVKDIRFEFHNKIEEGNSLVVFWDMHFQARGLNSGKPIQVTGNSHLEFDPQSNKVIYHRDYFDMGAMIYEKIPVIGRAVRWLRQSFEK